MTKEIKYCKCGCGGIPNPGNDYINGHNRKGVVVSDITRGKMSEGAIKRFEDPLEREKHSATQIKRFEENPVSDITREKMSEAIIKHYEDPLEREKMSEAQIKRFKENPVSDITREKLSVAGKKRYEDPLEHEKMSEGQIKRHEENPVSDITRGKMSEGAIKRFEDPLEREKHSAALQHIPYEDWESFASEHKYCPKFDELCRESNREKYGRKCFLTGLPEEENITKNGGQWQLSVHHVDMDKGQGCNGKRWKLVPICLKWHGKVHNGLWEARIIWLLDNVWIET